MADVKNEQQLEGTKTQQFLDLTGLTKYDELIKAEIAKKADKEHTHAISGVTGLQDALDAKASQDALDELSASTIDEISALTKEVIDNELVTSSALNELNTNLSNHKADDVAHITAEERTKWNSMTTGVTEDLKQLSGSVQTLSGSVVTLDGKMTTAETRISTAESDIDALQTGLTEVNEHIGDLNSLTTEDKDNLVEAINEVNSKASASKTKVVSGNGITVQETTSTTDSSTTYTVSAKVKSGDKYLEVTTDGIASKGIDTAIENAIKELDVTGETVEGKVVKAVSETDGKISVTQGYLLDTDIKLQAIAQESGSTFASQYKLVNGEGVQLGDTINIAKDQFLKEVHFYKTEEDVPEGVEIPVGTEFPVIRFIFTTAAGDTESWVSVKDLVDVYEAGDGLQLSGSTFSVKIDDSSEEFLTVGADGIKLSGVQSAIDTAKGAATAYTDSKIASLDATVGSTTVAEGKHVAVEVVEEDGKLKTLTVNESDIASAAALDQLSGSVISADTKVEELQDDLAELSASTESGLTYLESAKADKAETLEGYGITDAYISGNTITLGNESLTFEAITEEQIRALFS